MNGRSLYVEGNYHHRVLRVDGVECVCGWTATYNLPVIPEHGRAEVFAEHLNFLAYLSVPAVTRMTHEVWTAMAIAGWTADDFVNAIDWPKKNALAFLAGNYDPTIREMQSAALLLNFRWRLRIVDAITGVEAGPWLDEWLNDDDEEEE